MDCIYEHISNDHLGHLHKCKVCGRMRSNDQPDPEKIHRRCPGHPVPDTWKPSLARPKPDNAGPGFARRLTNFSLAAIKHVMAGMPTCTDEEINQRYAVCRGCKLFRPAKDNPDVGHCRHKDCGCSVSQESKFVSKLAWRDQDCPLGKWPELSPQE